MDDLTSMRSESSLSTTSNDSVQPSMYKRSPYLPKQPLARPSTSGGPTPSQSTSTLQAVPRHGTRGSVDATVRTISPAMPGQPMGHKARQHSQGFFEPSLPHATANSNGLSASQIAAQAAMHHISPPPRDSNERKRSYPGLAPINTSSAASARRPSDHQSPQLAYSNGSVGGNKLAATTAANVAFPNGRSLMPSPGLPPPPLPPSNINFGPTVDKEPKTKSSKMKLFKPKNIALSKEKESKAPPGAPSPGKTPTTANFLRGGFPNASVTSLVDPSSAASSIYSSANASTSTLVPAISEKDKEKRHHFLSRQKHKLRDEPAQLPLSSAHSNSQATNPDKPQPLYSFMPDSPAQSTFAKSMSGFDLRHGGRALREKKKEEKAAAAANLSLTQITSNTSAQTVDQYLGPSSFDNGLMGPPSGSGSVFSFPAETTLPVTAQAFSNIGAQMGLPGIGPDDAWPLLKARLLNLFSGENLRTPIEDFNALVSVHVRRCIQRRSPIVLVEDVRELLQTGFSSLAQTLKSIPDDRLVTNLVEMWIGVHGAILPFLQAVFLPLELELKGRGSLMTPREAQEFWGAIPEALKSDDRPTSAGGTPKIPNLADELEIRRITLIAFRDTVILPKHESLMHIFSRLSLDSINAGVSPDPGAEGRKHARSDPTTTGAERPGTAGSLSPRLASFNSQTSTLLDAASNSSGGAMSLASRSRATSNTSAGSFGTSMPHLNSPLGGPGSFNVTSQPQTSSVPLADPAKITETVARMLQCLYVLASCQTGDVAQGNVERLTGALKYNWLGRGRTGRDRRGWTFTINTTAEPKSFPGATIAPKLSAFKIVEVPYEFVNNHPILAAVLIPNDIQPGRHPVTIHWHGGGLVSGNKLYPDWHADWTLALAQNFSSIIISPDHRLLSEVTGLDIPQHAKNSVSHSSHHSHGACSLTNISVRLKPHPPSSSHSVVQQGLYPRFFGTQPELHPVEMVERVDNFPPLWLVHGIEDSLIRIEGSKKFVEALETKFPEARLHISFQEGEEHGSDNHAAKSGAPSTLETEWVREGVQIVANYWPAA